MKKSILALCALTLTAGLVACGGGTSSYTIGGTVSGLQYGPLVLTNNLSDDATLTPRPLGSTGAVQNVAYQFAKQLDYGDPYSVTIKTQPPHQVCVPSNAPGTSISDTAGRLSVINADFACGLTSHTIGGTITGLAASGLVLNNGSDSKMTIVKDPTTGAYPTTFAFTTEVVYGQTFGVTVLEQPTDPIGQTCTVKNGAGKMEDVAITTIEVTCVTNPVKAN